MSIIQQQIARGLVAVGSVMEYMLQGQSKHLKTLISRVQTFYKRPQRFRSAPKFRL